MSKNKLTKVILRKVLTDNINSGNKLMAVKNFKIATELGLKEAKEAIDNGVSYAMTLVTNEMLTKVYLTNDNQIAYLPKEK